MGFAKRKAKRAAKLAAKEAAKLATKAGRKKGNKSIIPTEKSVMDKFPDEAFKELYDEKMKALKGYCSPMREYSKCGLSLERAVGGEPNIIKISSDLKMGKELGDKVTKLCPGERGMFLHERSPTGLGLRPDESFKLCFSDNEFIGKVLRNVLTKEESLAVLEFEECHRRESDGWNRGCQADVLPRKKGMKRQLHSKRAIKATRINPDNTIVSVEPCGVGKTTGPKVLYKKPNGKIVMIPLSSYLFRAKFVQGRKDSRGISLDEFLQNGSQELRDLHSKLVDIYKNECREMGYTEEQIETDIKNSICINTNVIDDKESMMAIHHDPSTYLPALICGPSNFEYLDGEWKLKQRGGRLFVAEGLFNLEYGPRDVVILNGNIPHGITKMRPLPNDDGSKSSTKDFNRFSLVMFSRFRRTNMKCHGWQRRV